MKNYQFTAQIELDTESGMYVGIIPGLPGAHSQAKTLDELQVRMLEVIELCITNLNEDELKSLPKFIGVQQYSIAV